jgi:hypothetical protein
MNIKASRVSVLLARDFAVGSVVADCAVQTANATMPSGTRVVVLAVKTWLLAGIVVLSRHQTSGL